MLEDKGMTTIFVALEVGRSRLTAKVAIDALVVAVVGARNIFGILVGYISHNDRKVKSVRTDCNGFLQRVAKT